MTAATPIVALIDEAAFEGGESLLLAPAVGILKGVPSPGRALAGGEAFARLTILGRIHPLLLPDHLSGVVADLAVDGFGADAIPVEYGQPILTLAPREGGEARAASKTGGGVAGAARSRHAAISDLPAGCHAVVSPADGVLYRRPRPADPPYVEAGSRVSAGQTLALIEAMKCFSAITYGGAGLPDQAEVVEIRAGDAAEVRHGQVLFVVR